MSSESKAPKKSKGMGEFFGVDLDGVWKACELGMNAAVAYMVLACFSDETNRHTKASVKSVTKYTGISPKYAKQAIAALIDARLVGLMPGDSTRPNYEIFGAPPAPPPPRAYGYRKAKLAPAEQAAFESVGKGLVPLNNHATAAARRAVKKGWLVENADGFAVREAPPPPPPPDRKMVWLPNALVKGIGGTSPIERVRQTSNALVLRMLVDLYRLQTLTSDGGIDRDVLYIPFKSECLGSIHEFNVWFFSRANPSTLRGPLIDAYSREKVWSYIHPLEKTGLIQWSLQLFDAPDGGLLHPLGPIDDRDLDGANPSDALVIEREIGMAAKKAGRALWFELITSGKASRGLSETEELDPLLVPVAAHIAKPTVVGIARLRYRPKVSDTAKWFGQLVGSREGWLKGYGEVYQRTLSVDEKAVSW